MRRARAVAKPHRGAFLKGAITTGYQHTSKRTKRKRTKRTCVATVAIDRDIVSASVLIVLVPHGPQRVRAFHLSAT